MNEALALCEEIQWAKPTDEATLRTLSMVLKSAGKCKATKDSGMCNACMNRKKFELIAFLDL